MSRVDLGVLEMQPRVMYIEYKGGELAGPAKIGRVRYSKTGKTIYYDGKRFQSLKGGYKANYFDTETGEQYWITGCRKDGVNALYPVEVEVDEDAAEEYWVEIRKQPEQMHVRRFRMQSKY
ncbi:MAG: 1-deoxy-D-xylulose-5-phosphate synthase [Planctomycetota bacterium]